MAEEAVVAEDAPTTGDTEQSSEATETVIGEAVVNEEVAVDVENGETLLDAEPEAKEAEETAPIEYTDFSLPEGLDVPEENIASFKEMAKTAGLSQEQAQKMLDSQASALIADREAAKLHKEQEQKAWVDELKKDADFGGSKMKETVDRANRSIRQFGSPELITLLKDTGYANNPHVVRMLAKFDRAFSEDKLVEGKGTPMVEKTAAGLIYDHETSQT